MTPEEKEALRKKRNRKNGWREAYHTIGVYGAVFEEDQELGEPDGHDFNRHWERKRNKELPTARDNPAQPWYG
jgi:hypothetical protein